MDRPLPSSATPRVLLEIAERLDAYLDERLSRDCCPEEESEAVLEHFSRDPSFRLLVRKLRRELRAGS